MAGRCSLCGGKLKNGICTECGMNNRKSDAMYGSQMNRNECREDPLTHVHEEGKVTEYTPPALNKAKSASRQGAAKSTNISKGSGGKKTGKDDYPQGKSYGNDSHKSGRSFYTNTVQKRKSGGNNAVALTIVVIAVILGVVLTGVGYSRRETYSVTDGLSGSYSFSVPEYGEEDSAFDSDYDSDYDPYAYTSNELSEEGEQWEADLNAGMYLIGLDIPEGQYRAEAGKGMVLYLDDRANNIYLGEYFGDEEYEVNSMEDLRLFAGAVMTISGGETVHITSENAQISEMETPEENPLTEEYLVEEEATAGTDFQPGVYDLIVQDGEFGYVEYEIPGEDGGYGTSRSVLMSENFDEQYPDYSTAFRRVVLPEGATILTDGVAVRLVPSERSVSGDYLKFYENTY